jgi:hypothetical protein
MKPPGYWAARYRRRRLERLGTCLRCNKRAPKGALCEDHRLAFNKQAREAYQRRTGT